MNSTKPPKMFFRKWDPPTHTRKSSLWTVNNLNIFVILKKQIIKAILWKISTFPLSCKINVFSYFQLNTVSTREDEYEDYEIIVVLIQHRTAFFSHSLLFWVDRTFEMLIWTIFTQLDRTVVNEKDKLFRTELQIFSYMKSLYIIFQLLDLHKE